MKTLSIPLFLIPVLLFGYTSYGLCAGEGMFRDSFDLAGPFTLSYSKAIWEERLDGGSHVLVYKKNFNCRVSLHDPMDDNGQDITAERSVRRLGKRDFDLKTISKEGIKVAALYSPDAKRLGPSGLLVSSKDEFDACVKAAEGVLATYTPLPAEGAKKETP